MGSQPIFLGGWHLLTFRATRPHCPPSHAQCLPTPMCLSVFRMFLSMSSECLPCTPGHFCSASGLSAPSGPCAPGYFCLAGVSSPTPTGMKPLRSKLSLTRKIHHDGRTLGEAQDWGNYMLEERIRVGLTLVPSNSSVAHVFLHPSH